MERVFIKLFFNFFCKFFKVTDDGNYSRWICNGCHINVESTVQFFDLIINGQIQLKEVLKNQDERLNLSKDDEIFLHPDDWNYESKYF